MLQFTCILVSPIGSDALSVGFGDCTERTQLLNYSITQLLNYSITQLLNYSITQLLNYSITQFLIET
ncbi:hypothetical protein FORC17_p070 (plasmid) [Vibrio vulnificus]|nr:hypothetical protein FORC17_p070 [Vibrio vulnificus]